MTYFRRVKEDGHFYVKLYEYEGGPQIGNRIKWHGEEIQSEKAKEKIEKIVEHKIKFKTEKIEKGKEITLEPTVTNKRLLQGKIETWKKEGFAIPKGGKKPENQEISTGTRYTNLNTKHPFEYTIQLKGFLNDDPKDKTTKIITIVANDPLTRKDIQNEIKGIMQRNKLDRYIFTLKSFRVLNLLLNRNYDYQNSYKK